jgi:hypothetical protein
MRQIWLMLVVFPLLGAAAPELSSQDATGVLGRKVVDAAGKDIGRIIDVLVDPLGQPRAVVVDIGGFLGVGNRQVAVAWAALHIPAPDAADARVLVDMRDDQIKAAPDYTDPTKPATVVGPAAPPFDTPGK